VIGTGGIVGSDGLTDLFGLLAYAELVAFFNLSGDAALAPTLDDKAALGEMAVDEEGRRVEPRRHLHHHRLREVVRRPVARAERRFAPALAAGGPPFAAGFTAIASISTSSSGSTSRETTRMVFGG